MNWSTAIFYIKRLNNTSNMMVGGAVPATGVLEDYFPCSLVLNAGISLFFLSSI
jgi:hypothetical protein